MQTRRTRRNRLRRRRILVWRALLGAVGLALVVTPLWAIGTSDGPGVARHVEVTVAAGDTLWDLAREHGPEGADPRRTVRQICRLNGLRESTIFPQDRLLIPTE